MMIPYLLIIVTVILTSYGQLVLKWRLQNVSPFPDDFFSTTWYLLRLVFDPYILSSFAAAFIASLTWMAAIKTLELSKAYPWMSLSYVVVLFASSLLFGEGLTLNKIIGIGLIVSGVIFISR